VRFRGSGVFPVLLAVAAPLFAEVLHEGDNRIDLRGRSQHVYFYPAAAEAHGSVLFLPGDAGWRGFAVEMAKYLARSGFDVYGWDIKQYLSGFTTSRGTLSERDIQVDTAAMAGRLRTQPNARLVLVGWSQGAAMAVLAAADPPAQEFFAGVVALGLPESAVLGWRFADDLTYVTKADPKEPRFQTAPWIARIAPLRFGMIHSTADEYISTDAARQLFSLAREPRRLDVITAGNHRFSGSRDELFRKLNEQVKWASGQ
jgi:dienelactone hydrolase